MGRWRAASEGGTVALVGIADLTGELTLGHYDLLTGRTLVGVTEGNSVPQVYIPRLIELWRSGQFPFDAMITTYPFAEIGKAVDDSAAGRTVKAVLTF